MDGEGFRPVHRDKTSAARCSWSQGSPDGGRWAFVGRHGAINPAGRVRSFNTNALIGDEHRARQLGMERDYLLLKAASASRPSGERFPDHAAFLIVTCDGKATPHPFLAEAQDAPQLSPTFPTQTVVCTGDAQNTAEWVVRCAKLWNAESPTRRLTRNGSDSYAPWWRQF